MLLEKNLTVKGFTYMIHKFTKNIVGYVYCERCGLILFKNARTAKAVKEPCIMFKDLKIEIRKK